MSMPGWGYLELAGVPSGMASSPPFAVAADTLEVDAPRLLLGVAKGLLEREEGIVDL